MLLDEYREGRREQVWESLRALGDGVRAAEPFADARAVVRETMERVRHNVIIIHRRLIDEGYQFAHPERAHVPLNGNEREILDAIEQKLGGPMPLAFRAFHEIVGGVDFRQSPRQLVQWHRKERAT